MQILALMNEEIHAAKGFESRSKLAPRSAYAFSNSPNLPPLAREQCDDAIRLA